MKKKYIKSVFFFLMIMLLMIGITTVSATQNNDTNENNIHKTITQDTVKTSSQTNNINKEEIKTKENNDIKINKSEKYNTIHKDNLNTTEITKTKTSGEVSKENAYLYWNYPSEFQVMFNQQSQYQTEVTLKDENNNPITDGNVIFKFNNVETTTFNRGYGGYVAYYTPTSVGNVTINVTFTGSEIYNSVSLYKTIEVKKNNINLQSSFEHSKIQVGETTILHGHVNPTNNYRYFVGKPVVISVNGINYTKIIDDNNNFSFEFTPKTVSEYLITVTCTGDEYFEDAINNCHITVIDKHVAHLTANLDTEYGTLGDSGVLNGYLYDNNDRRISNQKILIRYMDEEYEVNTDENGEFLHEIKFNITGKYDVNLLFEGTSDYSEDDISLDFEVVDKQNNSVLTIDNITGYNGDTIFYGDKIYVNGKLTDSAGNPLSNIIYIENNSYFAYNGSFSVPYTVKGLGNVNITLLFKGSEDFKPVKCNKTIYVKGKLNLTIDKIPVSRDVDAGTIVHITGKLTDPFNNPMQNTNITLKLNNEDVKIAVLTDEEGVYSYNYTPFYAGENIISVDYSGNNSIYEGHNSYWFIVNDPRKYTSIYLNYKSNDTMEMYYGNYTTDRNLGDNITVYGLIEDNNNTPANVGTIIMSYNNVNYTLNVDDKGYFEYPVTLNYLGTHTFVAFFGGNENYTPERSWTNIHVIKEKVVNIHIEDSDIYYVNLNETHVIKGYIYDRAGNKIPNQKILIRYEDKEYVVYSDKNGDFTYNIKFDTLGSRRIYIIYEGTEDYVDASYDLYLRAVKQNGTVLTINSVTGDKNNLIYYGGNIIINGTLKDSKGTPMKNERIYNNIFGTVYDYYYARTNENGSFSLKMPVDCTGPINLTVLFTGNENFKRATVTLPITILNKSISLDKINTVYINSQVKIGGEFIGDVDLNVIVNDELIDIVHTNKKGRFNYTFNASVLGINNITVSYNGNSSYPSTTASTSFNVSKQDLKIKIDPIKQTVYGENTIITGKFTSANGTVRANAALKLLINGKSGSTRTDANGIFTYTTKVGVVGVNNVSVSHSGGSTFNPVNVSATFKKVKQNLVITLNTIKQSALGDNITITGKLTDANGVVRANTGVKLLINTGRATVKTDGKGVFTYVTNIGKLGKNNVTVSHPGGANYNPTNKTTTYTKTKQNLVITINPIKQTTQGDNITITGKLTDANGKIRANTGVKLLINTGRATVKTDSKGVFTYITTLGKVGKNNVTVSHLGGANFNPTSTSTTYIILKKDLKIVINNIKQVKYGDKVTITGKFTDAKGVIRANASVKVFINGKSASARTDSKGVFTFTSKVGVVGINNVTVGHAGGTNYNPVYVNKTFTMIKQDLKITLDPIKQVKSGANVTITGKFTDANGVIRKNSKVNIYVNGVYGSAVTDNKGLFKYSVKVTSVGQNKVVASHSGGANYNPFSTNSTFTVVK